jgi:hypothetical protein
MTIFVTFGLKREDLQSLPVASGKMLRFGEYTSDPRPKLLLIKKD